MSQFSAQPSAQGIASLYMGNPQPLQKQIQQEQKANPSMPPDLQKMLALQIALKTRKSADDEKAMEQLKQMGGQNGQMPTVMASLEQQAQQRMQAQQPPQMPQEETAAPRGAGIDQLPVEFTAAEGGIVAFGGGGSVTEVTREVLKELGESGSSYVNDPAVKQTVDKLVKERIGAGVEAAAESAAPAAAQAVERGVGYRAGQAAAPYLSKAGKALKGAAGTAIAGGLEAYDALSDMNAAQGFYDDPNVSTWEKAKQTARTGLKAAVPYATGTVGAGMGSVAAPVVGTLGGAAAGYGLGKLALSGMDDEGEALKQWRASHPNAAKTQTGKEGTPTSQGPGDMARPRWSPENAAASKAVAGAGKVPGAGGAGGAGGAAPGAGGAPREAMDPLETALNARIIKTLGLDEEAEYRKGGERFKNSTGLDALYKEMSDRAAAREARNAEAQAKRSPAWVEGLAGLGGAPVRGGLGMLLAKAGTGAGAAREAYDTEDRKFANEIDALRDNITKAKMEGNIKAAAAAEQALKDALSDRRQAEQSGTSLLNTREQARTRKQIAADAAAGRAQAASQASDMKKIAAAEGAFDKDPEVRILTKKFEDPLFAQSPEGKVALEKLRRIQADKYRQFGVTMATAEPDYKVSATPTGKTLALKP